MENVKKPQKKFPGWWMTVVSGITTGLGQAFCLRGFSAIFKPMSAELGLSRAATSGAAGIRSLQFGIMAPVTGWLCDRFGPKGTMLSGICLMCVGLILMSGVNSRWSYYVIWGVIIGMGNTIGLTIAQDKALTDWFILKRGRALSIRFILIAFTSAGLLPIVTWMITTMGWRTSCQIWACVMAIMLPLIWMIMKQKRPEYYGLLPDGGRITEKQTTVAAPSKDGGLVNFGDLQEEELSLQQTMKTQAYWMLILATAFGMIVNSGFGLHCIPFITDRGIDPTIAGSMMAMMIFFSVPSSLLAGLLADRIRKGRLKFLLSLAFLFQAIGMGAFLLKPSTVMLYLFLICFGFGMGPTRPLVIILRGRYFGRKAYGAIEGTSLTFETPFSMLSPIYTGWVYDRTGSYETVFMLFTFLAIFSALIMCFVKNPAS